MCYQDLIHLHVCSKQKNKLNFPPTYTALFGNHVILPVCSTLHLALAQTQPFTFVCFTLLASCFACGYLSLHSKSNYGLEANCCSPKHILSFQSKCTDQLPEGSQRKEGTDNIFLRQDDANDL